MIEEISDDSKHTRSQLQQGKLVKSLRRVLPELYRSLQTRPRITFSHGSTPSLSREPSPSHSEVAIELHPIARPGNGATLTDRAVPLPDDKEASSASRLSFLDTTDDVHPLISPTPGQQASLLPQFAPPQMLHSLLFGHEHAVIDYETARGALFHAFTSAEVLMDKPWTDKLFEGKFMLWCTVCF